MDVLIAHGSEAARRKLATTLGGQEVEVRETGQGAVALDVLMAADAPPLALIDWDLPGCDGPALCRLVRAQRGAGPPYIILLARCDQRLAEGLEAGADDCVRTPADADELRARVNVGRRFAALPWERVIAAPTDDAQRVSVGDEQSPPRLDAQRTQDDDGDGAVLPGAKFEMASVLVAH